MQTFTGVEYLKIDMANQMALLGDDGVRMDKRSFEDRIAWVDQYEEDLEMLTELAKKPFQYLAAVMAYRDAQNRVPTGHMVGCDASASGLQVFGALTGCHTTARSTGLIGPDCRNVYQDCTKEMNMILGSKNEYPEKPVKKALMTFFYGSKAKPKEVFGDGTPEHQAFFQAAHMVAPGACELLEILLESWQSYALSHDWIMPDGFTVHIPVMTTVESVIEIDELDHATFTYQHDINAGTEKGVSIAANVAHSTDGMVVRELCRRCNYDRQKLEEVKVLIERALATPDSARQTLWRMGDWYGYRQVPRIESLATESGFYSLVAVEYINHNSVLNFDPEYLEKILELINRTLARKSFPVVTIHDEFKAHPNNCNTVRQTYIDIMAEIAESKMLEFILSQIRSDYFEVEKYSEDLGDEIRKGNYAIS